MLSKAGTTLVLTIASVALFSTNSALASFTFFNVPGADWTAAAAISDSGFIAGYADDSPQVAFVRSPDGAIATFSVAPDVNTAAFAVNNNGAAAGYGFRSPQQGFVRTRDGTLTTFDPGSLSKVSRINNHGAVLGRTYTGTFIRKRNGDFMIIRVRIGRRYVPVYGTDFDDNETVIGYLHHKVAGQRFNALRPPRQNDTVGFIAYADGSSVTFQGPNGSSTTHPCCMSRKGWITGNYTDPSDHKSKGFLRSPDGAMTSFDAGNDMLVTGLSPKGVIVGQVYQDSRFRGFVRHPSGKIIIFDAQKGGSSTHPWAINAHGQIVGGCSAGGFVGTP